CSSCHAAATDSSDHELHDVASRAKTDEHREFRTAPLLFVGETAPYFHDGRYATLEALLADDLDRMGETTHLSKRDLDALAAYLRTL
ncbi:MAG TPA: cytochrome C peroxidase, partial [Byssovorax sp.]